MWALVTGSAKGLGRQIALRLSQEGYNICIHYNKSHQEASNTLKMCLDLGVKAEMIQGDLSSQESIQRFIEVYLKKIPQTNVLIHNVGNYVESSLEKMSCSLWDDIFQTNVNAPFLINKGLIESLKKTQGSIVHMGVAGLNGFKISMKAPAYFIAKTALLQLTKTFAKELFPLGIKVNMLSLGYLEDSKWQPLEKPSFSYTISYDDVISSLLFLLNKDNNSITGQNIEIASSLGL
jgi:3-oxoacyl-[acyl-carrier protein] reductase